MHLLQFNNYLLNTCYILGIVLGAGKIKMAYKDLTTLQGKLTHVQLITREHTKPDTESVLAKNMLFLIFSFYHPQKKVTEN